MFINRLQLSTVFLSSYGSRQSVELSQAIRNQFKLLRELKDSIRRQDSWWRRIEVSPSLQQGFFQKVDEQLNVTLKTEEEAVLRELEFVNGLVPQIDTQINRGLDLLDASVDGPESAVPQNHKDADSIRIRMHSESVPRVHGSVTELQRVMKQRAA